MIKSLLLMTVALVMAINTTYAQNERLKGPFIHLSVGALKKAVKEQTGYTIWTKLSDTAYHITITDSIITLVDLLDRAFADYGFPWKKADNQKVINIEKDKTTSYVLHGYVFGEKKEPMAGATVRIKGTSLQQPCDEYGHFRIKLKSLPCIVAVTMTGYQAAEKQFYGQPEVVVTLALKIDNLTKVNVNAPKKSTVPQPDSTEKKPTTPPTSAPSPESTTIITESMLGRAPVPTIQALMEATAGSVYINKSIFAQTNQSTINIRSRSTIDGVSSPLIMVDNFPYTGNLYNINPFDIREIKIIKDATGISKYGMSGNGIIHLAMKKGSYNQPLKVTALASLTIGNHPDLMARPQISSVDFEFVTKMLHQNNHYSTLPLYAVKPPNAAIYDKLALGQITPAVAEAALQELNNTDIRKEALQYLHQKSIDQQYYVSMEGGGTDQNFFVSFGHNKSRSNLIGNMSERSTLNVNNAFKPGLKGLEIQYGFYLSHSFNRTNGIKLDEFIYPNEKLTGPVTRSLSQSYKQTAVPGNFLNWDFLPLEDRDLRNNSQTHNTFLASTAIDYNFYKGLHLNLAYRLEKELDEQSNLYVQDSYYTRDLINRFSQPGSSDVRRPIPLGSISGQYNKEVEARNFKATLNYAHTDRRKNMFNATAGVEVRRIQSRDTKTLRYGITDNGYAARIDVQSFFPLSYEPGLTEQIPYGGNPSDTVDNFFSQYVNASFTTKNKYTVFASLRKDESNIFGVQANQKGVPLLSAGIHWDVAKESFFHSGIFQSLAVRLSNGYCANANKSYSALTAITSPGVNPWGAIGSAITNPPNPNLSWETIRNTNAGVDFSMFKSKLWGSIDYFIKEGKNLLGPSPIDPTSGVSLYRGNLARMQGHGLELALNASLGNKKFQWRATLLASYVKDKVTEFEVERPAIWYYCEPTYLSPRKGKPLYSVYSLRFEGLDPNGDPIGWLNDHPSKEYSEILQSTKFANLVYEGPATPPFFGSLNNTFTWKNFGLGFTINWKSGYYFRRATIDYSALYNGNSMGHPDFSKRWQRPGDEHLTNIPSMIFPGNPARDRVFSYSTETVEKGDHIRLQDVRLQYTINRSGRTAQSVPLELFIYAKDFKPIWRANTAGIDPDFIYGNPTPFNITIGVKAQF